MEPWGGRSRRGSLSGAGATSRRDHRAGDDPARDRHRDDSQDREAPVGKHLQEPDHEDARKNQHKGDEERGIDGHRPS
jgi:hypothetical protein